MKRAVAVVAITASIGVTACGGDGDAAAGARVTEMTIDRPRIGATPDGADAALYLQITAPSNDRLTAVETDVSAITSFHRTSPADGTMIDVDDFELDADTPVRLEPFGDHVMLEQVRRELRPGDDVEIRLYFAAHEPVEITAEVSQLYELAWEDS